MNKKMNRKLGTRITDGKSEHMKNRMTKKYEHKLEIKRTKGKIKGRMCKSNGRLHYVTTNW